MKEILQDTYRYINLYFNIRPPFTLHQYLKNSFWVIFLYIRIGIHDENKVLLSVSNMNLLILAIVLMKTSGFKASRISKSMLLTLNKTLFS